MWRGQGGYGIDEHVDGAARRMPPKLEVTNCDLKFEVSQWDFKLDCWPEGQRYFKHYFTLTKPLPFEGDVLTAFKSNGTENSRSTFSRKQGPEL